MEFVHVPTRSDLVNAAMLRWRERPRIIHALELTAGTIMLCAGLLPFCHPALSALLVLLGLALTFLRRPLRRAMAVCDVWRRVRRDGTAATGPTVVSATEAGLTFAQGDTRDSLAWTSLTRYAMDGTIILLYTARGVPIGLPRAAFLDVEQEHEFLRLLVSKVPCGSVRATAPFPKIAGAIWLVLLVAIFPLLLGLMLMRLMGLGSIVGHPALEAVASLVGVGVVILWGFGRTGATAREVFSLTPMDWRLMLPMSLTILGAGVLVSEADNMLRAVVPMPPDIAEMFEKMLSGEGGLGGTVLLLVAAAPLTEEFLFRGLILRGFLQNYRPAAAVLLSAVLFGIAHLNPWQFPGAVILGVLLAWWLRETRSIWPCIFGHAVNNGLALLSGVLLGASYATGRPGHVAWQPLWLDLLGMVLFAVGLYWSARSFGRARERSALLRSGPSASPGM